MAIRRQGEAAQRVLRIGHRVERPWRQAVRGGQHQREILARCPTEELALAHERHHILAAEKRCEILFNLQHATARSEAGVLARIEERKTLVERAEEADRLAALPPPPPGSTEWIKAQRDAEEAESKANRAEARLARLEAPPPPMWKRIAYGLAAGGVVMVVLKIIGV